MSSGVMDQSNTSSGNVSSSDSSDKREYSTIYGMSSADASSMISETGALTIIFNYWRPIC